MLYSCEGQRNILEHYLRLVTCEPESWLSAMQAFTTSPCLSLKIVPTTPPINFKATLSFLSCKSLHASGIYTRNATLISGINAGCVAIIMPTEGTVDFDLRDSHSLCNPWNHFILDRNEAFHATLSEKSQLFIVQLPNVVTPLRNTPQQDSIGLNNLLIDFLYETPFFRDHKHAINRLEQLSRTLYQAIDGDLKLSPELKIPIQVSDNRRLCKAIQIINIELNTDINIKSIASRSGLSLRNLHYLMKKIIGHSPYQYIRARRLIKARESIIRDHPGNVSISQTARNYGFQHAGRFARYYYQHFSEYPHETLRELDHLKQLTNSIMSADRRGSETRQLWITSSLTPKHLKLEKSS